MKVSFATALLIPLPGAVAVPIVGGTNTTTEPDAVKGIESEPTTPIRPALSNTNNASIWCFACQVMYLGCMRVRNTMYGRLTLHSNTNANIATTIHVGRASQASTACGVGSSAERPLIRDGPPVMSLLLFFSEFCIYGIGIRG
ncbi:hypothetical protein GQ43DRAFT_460679 [Delitschia confertaspora ATCC 74209]|uniref:Uncharacterized protein n=1 Tax=Delitschia confertaspora ATCC 74209 TaxID=1513339 RepID=A0A9P4JUA5_9PLEO|nr:hypothetical protein GQ43DRAFT_460679 [Delitschia confertaspora ATCC 74209]